MPLEKEGLKSLYESGKSMQEIAQAHGISLHQVAYWIKKYGIPARSLSDATYRKHNPNGDPFKISKIDSKAKSELLALGVALYLGEGTKKYEHGVRLANSDAKIIKLFLYFLKVICGVEIEKIRAWINIFDDKLYTESLKYWSKEIGIPVNQFYSPVIRPRKVGTYKNKSSYGTITILVDNKKLLDQIKKWCDSYLEKYADLAQW